MPKKIFSVMFHHLHDEIHKASQGSLSITDFKAMIEWLNINYSLIGAREYKQKFENNTLKDNDICLSFDDALKCQYDIAIPILKEYGLDAFFFIYSSVFHEKPSLLEIYRYFRTTYFDDIEEFYSEFFQLAKSINPKKFTSHALIYKDLNYLSSFPFYSKSDKWFRYLRDIFLEGNNYSEIMSDLMIQKKFNIESANKLLFMTEEDVIDMDKKGHVIGLHSYSHPTQMNKLNKNEQKFEYQKNCKHLEELIKKPITTMSHPCGNYNEDTLTILSELNIKIGFRSSLNPINVRSSLEIPREDQANILKIMNK